MLNSRFSGKIPVLKIFKSEKDNLWYWNIKVISDIIASSSEGYVNRSECLENILNTEKRITYLRENNLIK
jgi:uncharacterized protein YegP (UPF0339 family)